MKGNNPLNARSPILIWKPIRGTLPFVASNPKTFQLIKKWKNCLVILKPFYIYVNLEFENKNVKLTI